MNIMSHFITFCERTNGFATDQCDQNILNGNNLIRYEYYMYCF